MKKQVITLLIVAVLCVGQAPAVLAESPLLTPNHIIISELQTGGAQDATEEFVELYNPNSTAVDITGWQLQYRAASGTATQAWPASSTKATITCPTGSPAGCKVEIEPQGRIVLVHTLGNIAGALAMNGGFSATGGQVRLVQTSDAPIVQDFIGYGTAISSEGSPAIAPALGKSIKRVIDPDGNPIDTDNNLVDFIASCGDPTPGVDDTTSLPYSTGCAVPDSGTTTSPDSQDSGSSDTPTDNSQTTDEPGKGAATLTYLPVIITEVFPDPAPPQQDSTDEFIEFYNPNDTAITLSGYTLQTGSDWRYHFTLGDTPLGPHDYIAIGSAVTKLSLSNSGSGVRLIDPNGLVAYEVPNYMTAKEGQSWMQDDTGWKWSLTPTPNAPNILTVPAAKTSTTTGTTQKKTTVAKTIAAKIALPKAPKASTAKKSTAKTASSSASHTASATPTQNPQYWLLLPIGLIAGGYALYEYRQEISRVGRKIVARLSGKKAEATPLLEEPKQTIQ